MEEKNRKEALLKTFEGQIFLSSIDYLAEMGLNPRPSNDHIEPTPISSVVPEEVTEVSAEMDSLVEIQQNESQAEAVEEMETTGPVDYGLQLLFVGETPADHSEESGEDLLSKMIGALNLPAGAVSKYLLNRENEDALNLINQKLEETSPRAVVTLGAFATNLLLDKKTKLSKVHGQEQKYKYQQRSYSFFPLFHPDYLNINPNMKRTAWNDLKKVLEFLSS